MINITKVTVPDDVKYMSQWTDYELPGGHCVIDKTICGCGFTEYCLGFGSTNKYPTVLCSPRITLLENKYEKHKDEMGFFYYRSELAKELFEGQYDGVIPGRNTKKSRNMTDEEKRIYNKKKFDFACSYVRSVYNNCACLGIPCRIICTYDSYHVIREALSDVLGGIRVIVDEFQSIFNDAYFKADVESEFFGDLQITPNVIYLSATPMLKDYLEGIPGFDNIQYYKFIWPKSRVTTANVKEYWVSSLEDELSKIIKLYKTQSVSRPFKTIDGMPVFSNHAIFYVNSVNMIRRLIIHNHLTPDECNIICSKSDPKTAAKVKAIKHSLVPPGSEFSVGRVPLEGEPHKMFTFCTSTAYLGADFYHTDGMSYVASDANVLSLVVDIRLDLPQILGRQRLETNPWKNDCIIFYKTLSPDKMISEENFKKWTLEKKENSIGCLKDFENLETEESVTYYIKGVLASYEKLELKDRNSLTDEEKKRLQNFEIGGNTKSYLGVKTYYVQVDDPNEPGKKKSIKKKTLVYNYFLETAERRAWEVSQVDYRSDVSVTRSIADLDNIVVTHYTPEDVELAQKLIDTIKSIPRFDDKLKTYCEAREAAKGNEGLTKRILDYYKGQDLENLYSYFGLEGCRANSFEAAELKKILNDDIKGDLVRQNLYKDIKLKEVYSLKSLKEYLRDLYTRLGMNKTPKASDILEYFEVREKKVTDSTTKKRVPCYQIISIK